MKGLSLVFYNEKGFPSSDIHCAICTSKEDVERFIKENNDITIVHIIENNKAFERIVRGVVIKILSNEKLSIDDRYVLKDLLKGGIIIGKRYPA